jgi:hypothetical protein
MRWLLVIVLLVGCTATSIAAPPKVRPGLRPYLLPVAAIQPGEMQHWEELLLLSDGQRQFLSSLVERYFEELKEVYERDFASLQDSAAEVAEMARARTFTPEFSRLNERHYRKQDQYNGRVIALDETLFAQLQDVLSEEQAAKMPQVRASRERLRYPIVAPCVPGATLDWMQLCGVIELPEQHRDLIRERLLQYEQRIGSLRKERHHLKLQRRILHVRFLANRWPLDEQAIMDRRSVLLPLVRADVRLREANLAFLKDASALLGDDAGAILFDIAYATMHPKYLGDRSALLTYRAAAAELRNPDIDDDSRLAIYLAVTEYRTKVEKLALTLDDRIFQFERQWHSVLTLSPDDEAEHEIVIADLRRQYSDAGLRFRKALTDAGVVVGINSAVTVDGGGDAGGAVGGDVREIP